MDSAFFDQRQTRAHIAVDHLAESALVVTDSNELSPVRWIGHAHRNCTRHPNVSAADKGLLHHAFLI